jgi:hypothetical protein
MDANYHLMSNVDLFVPRSRLKVALLVFINKLCRPNKHSLAQLTSWEKQSKQALQLDSQLRTLKPLVPSMHLDPSPSTKQDVKHAWF